jgi:hypothetical protein
MSISDSQADDKRTFKVSINPKWPGQKLPSGDPRWDEFTHSFQLETHTLDSFIKRVTEDGYAFCAALKGNHRISSEFASMSVLAVDHDTSPHEKVAADEFVTDHGAFTYATPSSTAEMPRSRSIFVLDQAITDAEAAAIAQDAVIHYFNKETPELSADEGANGCVRFFWGRPNAGRTILGNILYRDILNDLIDAYQADHQGTNGKSKQKQSHTGGYNLHYGPELTPADKKRLATWAKECGLKPNHRDQYVGRCLFPHKDINGETVRCDCDSGPFQVSAITGSWFCHCSDHVRPMCGGVKKLAAIGFELSSNPDDWGDTPPPEDDIPRETPENDTHEEPSKPIQIPGWKWDAQSLSAMGVNKKGDVIWESVLSWGVAPLNVTRVGDDKYLTLLANHHQVSLSAEWPGMQANAAAKHISSAGCSVTVAQTKTLQRFVADAFERGLNIPRKSGVSKLGWHKEDLCLGLPDDPLKFVVTHVDARPLAAYGQQSDIAEAEARKLWHDVLADASVCMWPIVGAAIGSLLLAHLPRQYPVPVIHHIGKAQTGKTTTMNLAASIYGDPGPLVQSWYTTIVGFERRLIAANHLPVFMDEVNAADRLDRIPTMIMMACNGISKIRGSLDGLREGDTWRNVVLSTGETAAFVDALGGVARRVILNYGSLRDKKEVDAFNNVSNKAYGWPLKWLRPEWRQHAKWTEAVLRVTPTYESKLQRNHAYVSQGKTWALIQVGARILAKALHIDEAVAIKAVAAACEVSATHQSERMDQSDRLHWAVLDDVVANAAAYGETNTTEKGTPIRRRGKLLGDGTVAVLRVTLDEIARTAGITDVVAAMNVLREKDLLVSEKGKNSIPKWIDNRTVRVHVFRDIEISEDEEG